MLRLCLVGAFVMALGGVSAAQTGPSTESPLIKPQPIKIVGQLSLVLTNGTGYAHCVTFINVSEKKITAVAFQISLFNENHVLQGRYNTERAGEFSPGVVISGPNDVSEYNLGTSAGGLIRGASQKLRNCWTIAAAGASTFETGVTRATFDDGTQWTP
jgi:hypothetical protein